MRVSDKGVNPSTPRPIGLGLPFDKLKAPSTVEGLGVHPEPRLSTPPSKAGLRAAEWVKRHLRGRLIRGFLSLSFLFGILLADGFEGRAETKPSLGILPFLVERVEDPGRGAVCPICKRVSRSGEILPGSPNTLTRLLYQKMETIGTFNVVPQEQLEEVFFHRDPRRFEEKPIPSSLALGREVGVDFLLVGILFRFEERIGSSIGVERPASVSFDIHLFRVRDEKMIWIGKFDETQRPLSENLLKIRSFIRRKGTWLKAAELASVGMDEMLRELPGLKELEK